MIPAHTPGSGQLVGLCSGFPAKNCLCITARTIGRKSVNVVPTTSHTRLFMRQHLLASLQVTLVLFLSAPQPVGAQQIRDHAELPPVPREPDGRPSFGPLPGQSGVWMPRGTSSLLWDLD